MLFSSMQEDDYVIKVDEAIYLDSAHLGNFGSTAGMWWEHCKAQKACNCAQKL